jgi:hypothetical protein
MTTHVADRLAVDSGPEFREFTAAPPELARLVEHRPRPIVRSGWAEIHRTVILERVVPEPVTVG